MLAAAPSLWPTGVIDFRALERRAPQLTVTNICDAASATGLMRQFIFEDMIESRRISSRHFPNLV